VNQVFHQASEELKLAVEKMQKISQINFKILGKKQ